MNKKLMTTPYALPSLTLTTPLSIGSGGSGQSTASGTGLPVHQTSSTLNSPLLQSASITGALTLFGSNAITSQTGLNNLGSTQPSIVGSISPVLDNKLTITGDSNSDDSAQIYLQANANFPTAITFGQISGSGGDGSSYTIGRLTGTAGQLQITSSLAAYAPLIIDSANGNFILNNVNTYIQSGASTLVQFNSTNATFSVPIIQSSLTASLPVFSNSSKQLVSTGVVGIANGGTGLSTIGGNNTVLTSNGTVAAWAALPSTANLVVTASVTFFGAHIITTQSGMNSLGSTAPSLIGSISPTFDQDVTIIGDPNSSSNENGASLLLHANANGNGGAAQSRIQFGQISGSGGDGTYWDIQRLPGTAASLDFYSSTLGANALSLSGASVSLNPAGTLTTGGAGATPFQYTEQSFVPIITGYAAGSWSAGGNANSGFGTAGITPISTGGSCIKVGKLVTIQFYASFSYGVIVGGPVFICIQLPFAAKLSAAYNISGVTNVYLTTINGAANPITIQSNQVSNGFAGFANGNNSTYFAPLGSAGDVISATLTYEAAS